MTLHAWKNYKQYAWGKNELRPLSKKAHTGSVFGTYELGATIVDSMDTLYIMGLEEEYQEGRKWISERFSFQNIVCRAPDGIFQIIFLINLLISCRVNCLYLKPTFDS